MLVKDHMSASDSNRKTTPVSYWVMIGAATVLAAASLVAVLPLLRPRPTDKQVIQEAMHILEAEFRKLPDDHPIIERYGRFVSMPAAPSRFMHHAGGKEYGGAPPSIGCDLICRFEKFPAQVGMGIYPGHKNNVELLMEANFAAYKKRQDFGKETLELDGEDLWVHITERSEGKADIKMKSTVDAVVTYPGFHPK